MEIQDVFAGRAKKYNQFSEGEHKETQRCGTCIRKNFSFPYTCNEGWPIGDPTWIDKGSKCINWTDDSNCRVD